MIRLATAAPMPSKVPEIVDCDPTVRAYLHTPWFRAWLNRQMGVNLFPANVETKAEPVGFSEQSLSAHSVIVGASGYGKTRAYLKLAGEMMKRRYSFVSIDIKHETLLHLLELAREAGIKPHQISFLYYNERSVGVPGWNPLAGGDPQEAAAAFSSFVWQSAESGPQMAQVLACALTVICAHELSIFELHRMLSSHSYRSWLLEQPPTTAHDPVALKMARDYFLDTYQPAFASSVNNKLFNFVMDPFMRSLTCAKKDTVNFPALWDEQRIVLIHIDETLGTDAVQLLGGMASWRLYYAAMKHGRRNGVPVAVGFDEIGLSSGLLIKATQRLLRVAREKGVRLIAATQSLATLPNDLQEDLLTNTAARAFFRLGKSDKKEMAEVFSEGESESAVFQRITLASPKRLSAAEGGGLETAAWSHPLLDATGKQVILRPGPWEALLESRSYRDPMRRLRAILDAAGFAGFRRRLCVRHPLSGQLVSLEAYFGNIPWVLKGPGPITIEMSFPRPRIVALPGGKQDSRSRWSHILHTLPQRAAIYVEPSQGPPRLAVTDAVPDVVETPQSREFLQAVLRQGQSKELAESVFAARVAAVDAAGKEWEAINLLPAKSGRARASRGGMVQPLAKASPPRKRDAPIFELAKQILENPLPEMNRLDEDEFDDYPTTLKKKAQASGKAAKGKIISSDEMIPNLENAHGRSASIGSEAPDITTEETPKPKKRYL